MKKLQAAIVGLVAVGAVAATNPWKMLSSMSSGALKVWSTNERIQAVDLNGNFSQHETTKIGGGVQASNSDISASAAIAHSKLATPALVPKAWTYISATCAAGTCTAGDSSQVTSITFNATGIYNVNLAYTPANANFAPVVTSHTANVYCITTGPFATVAPQFNVRCYTDTTGAATNASFSVLVMDS